MSAQMNEVAGAGRSTELPVHDVVDIAAARETGATRECACHIRDLEPPPQIGGRAVGSTIDIEQRAAYRMCQQSREGRRMCSEAARGLGIDRAVALEGSGLVFVAEQSHHGNGDCHGDRWRTPALEDSVEEQVADHVASQLAEGARLVRLTGKGSRSRVDTCEGAVSRIGRQLHREVRHAVDVVVDPDAAGLSCRLGSLGQCDRVDAFA